MNSKIIGLEKLLGDTNQSSQVENELGLAQYAQMELREASSYYAAFTSNISSSLTFSGTTLSVEFRLLRNLASRLMTESNHYRQHSKLTRVISELLLEILNLRRSLTGITQDSSCIHSEIIEDWKWIKTTFSRTTTPSGKSIRHEGENHSDVEKPQPTFIVTQISSNSITISWSGLPESDDWNNQHSKSSTTSHGRIAASVGGLLASIKGSTPQALHTSYSLYITPLSGSQQTLPLEQRSRSLLVLPYVSPRGSQKIDLLDPGLISSTTTPS